LMKNAENTKAILALICAKLVLYLILPAYAFFRIYFLVFSDAGLPVKAFSFAVFLVEIYFIVQTASYLINFIGSVKQFPKLMGTLNGEKKGRALKVAVLVPAFNEPADIVEGTLETAREMDYPNKEVYLLDDSDQRSVAELLEEAAARQGAQVLKRSARTGFKAGSLNDAISRIDAEYIAVLDSDQQPERDFLAKLIPIFEADERVGYIQTPQAVRPHPDGGFGFIERGAAATQNVFYNYVCEGKGVANSQFSCGSNVVYRRSALESIRREQDGRSVYMDEWSVTEDYATSILLQEKGWKSLYYTGTCARGLVPSTYQAFCAQRRRWAVGTLSVFRKYAKKMLFSDFSLRQRWEYLSSGAYFLLGLANFLMLLNIAVLIIFKIPTYATFLPPVLFVSNMVTFYFSQNVRGNRSVDLFYEQVLNYLIFPVYIDAFITVLLGRRTEFSVTAKRKAKEARPNLVVQELALICCIGLFYLGLWDLISAPSGYMALNLFWLLYSMALLYLGICFVLFEKRGGYPAWSQVCPQTDMGKDARRITILSCPSATLNAEAADYRLVDSHEDK